MINKKFLAILTITFLPILVIAQQGDSIKLPMIHVLARVTPNKVILRWAPDNANAWLLGNRYGYMVERYTFLKNGKLTADRQKTVLTPIPVKPWPIERWEKMADTSDFAAVAAQAIYGSDFEVDVNKSGNMYSIFNKAKETESRFTFALHSANQSVEVAQAAGLYFNDTTTKNTEAYLYRIYIPLPKELMLIDTGKLFVDAGKTYQLPKLREVTVATSGNSVMLSWSSVRYEREYVSYIVERSDDGGYQYHRLSVRPFVSLGNDEAAIPGRVIYIDSVPIFNYQYFYRVRGKTSFAETGPPSDSIKATAQKVLYNSPTIKSGDILNNKVVISWEMPDKTSDAIKGFYLERAYDAQGNYSRLNSILLMPEKRSYTDTVPDPSNYYRVSAIDKEGNAHASLPHFVQLEDSIPPLSPTELSGTIDTTGTVHLVWKNNAEADLLGYRVYRSYFKISEFVQVTIDPIKSNKYTENIKLRNLNKYLYYRITANDTHHNQSGFSTIFQLRQPDIIAPSSPAIRSVKATTAGIELTLVPSSSDDVEKYVVYRKENSDSIWTLQKELKLSGNQLNYNDTTTSFGKIYSYNVLAVDSSGNESLPARSIRCKAINANRMNDITMKIRIDMENKAIEIQWSTERTDLSTIILYKSIDNEPITQYLTRPAQGGVFSDTSIKQQHSYKYMIKAVFKDGTESGFSKTETMNYE